MNAVLTPFTHFAAPHDPELAFQTGLDLFIAGLEQRLSTT
jgi:hypothetical protein